MPQKNITILGSTGSVGKSALEIVRLHPEKFNVFALTANNNIDALLEQCQQFEPKYVAFADVASEKECIEKFRSASITAQVLVGADAINQLAMHQEVDQVLSAIVGAAGLLPTLSAVQAGKQVLIANKEPLVMTGQLFMQEALKSGATILPLDSEHNAIFQCLPNGKITPAIRKLHLTASGGPFLNQSWQSLEGVTPEQACTHPNWSMGRKISVDSATMMNKGLELIEAAALYQVESDDIDIIIHPQSIIHSLVEYIDGSFLAQLGTPDMKIPIAHAMAWPERIESGAKFLDFTQIQSLNFQAPDMGNLPCLRLARQAAKVGGNAPITLNAANEVAVGAFLHNQIKFTQIANVIDLTLTQLDTKPAQSINEILQLDNEARQIANSIVASGLSN